MSEALIISQFTSLPNDLKREVSDFIEFLYIKYERIEPDLNN